MGTINEHHKKLNTDGIGKCSVPMWLGGAPSGFCNEPAFGERPDSPQVWHSPQQRYVRADGRYDGYVPGLACPCHGGPSTRAFLDGDQWCAVHTDFVNVQESPAGFGDTPDKARSSLSLQPRGATTKEHP